MTDEQDDLDTWTWQPETSCWASNHEPQILRLDDFCVSMPHLATGNLDLQNLPFQIKAALNFLRVVCPWEVVTNSEAAKMPTLLPPLREENKMRRTVVLDLDETLVHCRPSPLDGPPAAMHLRIEQEKLSLNAHVYVRPYAPLLLETLATCFEVVIFTASAEIYADKVLDFLDPHRRCIAHRLYRQHCTVIQGGHLKDVRRLGRRVEDVVLVDNSPVAVGLVPSSGILVSSWFGGDLEDVELLNLLEMLERCSSHASTQEFLSKRYGVSDFLRRLCDPTVAAYVLGTPSAPHTGPSSPPGPITQMTRP